MEDPNDLSILDPQPRVLHIPGIGAWGIYPLRVRQLQRFVAAILPILPAVMASMESDADIGDALAEHRGSVVATICTACDTTTDRHSPLIAALSDDVLRDLLAAVVSVNGDFFQQMRSGTSDGDAEPPGQPDQPKTGWADTLQALVNAGHRPADIMNYTLAQVRWWGEAIQRAKSLRHADEIIASRMTWAEPEKLGEVLRGLGVRV